MHSVRTDFPSASVHENSSNAVQCGERAKKKRESICRELTVV
jgi:hypothetical protein